jgi:hypothetical protein
MIDYSAAIVVLTVVFLVFVFGRLIYEVLEDIEAGE